jgi:fatty acid desaturase
LRAPGSGSPVKAEHARRATTAARAVRIHAGIYIAAASVLTAVNAVTGHGWWSFWPVGVWGVALGVHYIIYKAKAVDERWAEERAADLRSKSYDASHIDDIARDRGAAEDAARERK